MRIVSPLEKEKYLHDLRCQMESWFAFGQPRFTGVVLGNFLYITHHAGYEWNRRITNEKSRAIGFVTRYGDGCQVKLICFRGYLDPVSLVLNYLIYTVFVSLAVAMKTAVEVNPFVIPELHLFAAGLALFIGLISFAECWFTERGHESMTELLSLLRDPEPLWEKSEL